MADIIKFPGYTRLDLPPERILEGAMKTEWEGVMVIGWTKEGDEYFASSIASGPDCLWLLERSKKKLLDVIDHIDETSE
jgi:hypothetical protein